MEYTIQYLYLRLNGWREKWSVENRLSIDVPCIVGSDFRVNQKRVKS